MADIAKAPERASALELALARTDWYHTIELAPDRVTRGLVDLRSLASTVLPGDLAGARALDVGTFDGFWAYELERRGADVVATDVGGFLDSDWPPPTRERLGNQFRDRSPGERFELAQEALGSKVRRVECSIHELDPVELGGPFEFVVVGWLLMHLRDPVGGLEAIHRVLRPGGQILVLDQIDLGASILRRGRPWARLRALEPPFDWWVGNVACLRAWLQLAGFEHSQRRRVFRIKAVKVMRHWAVALVAERA